MFGVTGASEKIFIDINAMLCSELSVKVQSVTTKYVESQKNKYLNRSNYKIVEKKRESKKLMHKFQNITYGKYFENKFDELKCYEKN